jgi:retron-type reverse transcriptase
MNLWNETKSVPVRKEQIWLAYKKVQSNQRSAGIDSMSMEEFGAQLSKHLYKLWNRMTSSSYFLKALMKGCGLELHPEKTKLVHCRDYRRQDTYETVKFDFL